MLLAGDPGEVPQGTRCDSMTGDSFGNAITNPRRPIDEVVEVQAPHDVVLLVDKHIEDALASFLLSQECAVSLSELRKEIVATIGDELAEVGAICQLEGKDRGLVPRTQAL